MTPPSRSDDLPSFDLQTSRQLHDRVRRFVDDHMAGRQPVDSFDALAVDLARHQHACRTGVERLYLARGVDVHSLDRASQVPAVPTDVFKLRRVACHPPDLDEVVFLTSGTTLGTRGQHAVRDADTYRRGARAWASRILYPDTDKLHWVILAPPYEEAASSSLGFMLDDLSRVAGSSVTWAVQGGRVQVGTIERAVAASVVDERPIIVAGASFAFVHLLDALGGRQLPIGPGGRVMQTGGFKGKSRVVDGDTLRDDVARALGVGPERIVSEYGMTELGSQAYEGRLRVGQGGAADVFHAPPWMRVHAVHEETLEPVDEGDVGIARIEDLANVDSAVAVQTADRIRVCEGGFRLLGRNEGASPRGCSIGIDEILQTREDDEP
ncbi:MAG: acyl-protein synthetase [Deltaproteobacteria bacterium HGW-Deltaproteobacteria-20]|jgi:hypothetical protein|nr:MAG: acyl-protein synthetase [Deltaproteobacteria bacterium HGW-Deltaproteobacteria-20]